MDKRISDAELYRLIGLPVTTARDWKKRDDYRKVIYELIKNMSKEEIKRRLKKIGG